MSSSWDYEPARDPTIGNEYILSLEQIWGEVRGSVMMVVPETNLVKIILDYSDIDDFNVFSQILAIHVPGIATLTNHGHTYNVYLGSTQGCSRPWKIRRGYIHVVATNGTWRLEAKEKRFSIDIREMFQSVQARDYMRIAKYMKSMLYKSYRPNLDKLEIVAKTCAEVMNSHAKFMLRRLTMEKLKKEDILPEIDPDQNTRFWSIFTKKRTYRDVLEKSE